MNKMTCIAVGLLSLSACCAKPVESTASAPPPPTQQDTAPVRTSITDLDTFNAFIATRPTPEALRTRYPGLLVVTPGTITTRELRGDNSRYFVELDEQGKVIGGRFQ